MLDFGGSRSKSGFVDGDGKGGFVVLPYSPNSFPQCLIVFNAPSRKGIGIVVAPFQKLHKKSCDRWYERFKETK